MSLLSETKSQVGECNTLITKSQTIVYPPLTIHLPLLTGTFKQAVGYAYPREALWTYVIDLHTGRPLQLPQGSIPMSISITPTVALLQGDENNSCPYTLYTYFINFPNDPDNHDYTYIDSWCPEELNNKTVDDTLCQSLSSPYCGLSNLGYNYIAVYNDYYPDITFQTGCLKFVVEYL